MIQKSSPLGLRLVAGGTIGTSHPPERAPASWVTLAAGIIAVVALAAFAIFVL